MGHSIGVITARRERALPEGIGIPNGSGSGKAALTSLKPLPPGIRKFQEPHASPSVTY